MQVTLTKCKKWWQIWISNKPRSLIEGIDFKCDDVIRNILKRKNLDVIKVEFQYLIRK